MLIISRGTGSSKQYIRFLGWNNIQVHNGVLRDAPWVAKPKYDQYDEPIVVAQRYSLPLFARLPTVYYSSKTATELRRRIGQDKQRSLRLSKSVAWMRS